MIPPRYAGKGLRILDFDIENRPLNYAGQDFTFSDVTAIACCTIGNKRSLSAWVLGDVEPEEMLTGFLERYTESDMLTGHNIVRHDLPILDGMCLEYGLGPLEPKLVQDTYLHLRRRAGVSGSQESLAEMLGVPVPKVQMSQVAWRQANRLLPEGLVKTRARAVGDVLQHIEVRRVLLQRNWLRAPKMWNP